MDKLQFEIDQLRKDKIIYAVEACATSLAVLLLMAFLPIFFVGTAQAIFIILALLIGVGYTIFMGIGNFKRLKRIKELEKKLK